MPTSGGLNRYDGNEMKTYKQDPDDPESISFWAVNSILEDQKGYLWLTGYGSRINRYDPKSDAFKEYVFEEAPQSMLYSLYEDSRGNLWVGSWSNGILRFDREQERFLPFPVPLPKEVENDLVKAIYEDSDGSLWFGVSTGLYRFSWKDSSFTFYSLCDRVANREDLFVQFIVEDSQNRLWVGAVGCGMFLFDHEENAFSLFRPDQTKALGLNCLCGTFCEDDNGWLWVGDDDGLFYIDPQARNLYRHPNDPNVQAIYKDLQGDMWLGTNGSGIAYWSQHQKAFTSHFNLFSVRDSNQVFCFLEQENGDIWMGTNNGLRMFDPHQGKMQTGPSPFPSYFTWTLAEDPEGWFWLGSWSPQLKKIHIEQKKEIIYKYGNAGSGEFPTGQPSAVFADRKGTLWMGFKFNGLYHFDPEENTFIAHPLHDPKSGIKLGAKIATMYEDKVGNLWLLEVNQSGLTRLSPDRNEVRHYPNDIFRTDYIIYMLEDHLGRYWLGTNLGLALFDPEVETVRFWNTKDGLADNGVTGILEDDRGNLWVSTLKGLSRFSPETESFRNYNHDDGLPSDQFEYRACLKSQTGEFYFGTTNGFVRFYPDSIWGNPYIPPVVITDFQIRNQPVPVKNSWKDSLEGSSPLSQQIIYTRELQLDWNQNDLSFEFAALNFFQPEKNLYKYRLENYDKDWIATTADRPFAHYTNLTPGSYIFRVIGSNNDGIWNEEGARIEIMINPPWWKTWWAFCLYGMAILLLLWTAFRYETNRHKLRLQLELEHVKAENLAEISETKSRFFANISHEFRTPLTLIQGPVEELIEKRPRSDLPMLKMIQRNSLRLLTLINQLLDLAKLEAKGMKLKASRNDLLPFLRQTFAAFESKAESQRIHYTLHSEVDSLFLYFDPDKLEKVVLNLLSNAFKFTPEGGTVKVSLKSGHDYAVIAVSDTGPGIPQSEQEGIFDRFSQVDNSSTRAFEGTGIGLALAKELVELHHGKIGLSSKEGAGTTFSVKLPIGQEHLDPEEIGLPESAKAVDLTLIGTLPQGGGQPAMDLLPESELPLVLIVDDNSDMREYIRRSIGELCQVVEASDGNKGLAFAQEHIPDMIISDVMMPGMDGFELCRLLKSDARSSHIPIMLLTAKSGLEARIEGIEQGADAYLTKPFHKEEIRARLLNLIELRKKLQQRYKDANGITQSNGKAPSPEDLFMQSYFRVIRENLRNEDFDTPRLCKELGMSRAQLYRKVKALTNETVGFHIRKLRLQEAKRLLETSDWNISEIAFEVGFKDPSYFSRAFREEFGLQPNEAR